MRALEFRSEDSRFRARLSSATVRRLLKLCQSSVKHETGGILLGHYSEALDCAWVRKVSDPPPDSERGLTWFKRGTKGLQALLDHCWDSGGNHYLGEWHFHPFVAPTPSVTDLGQLTAIAHEPGYGCPEPLLLIVGGDPSEAWSISVHVVPRGHRAIPLLRI
ncbi:Mov34/MPN/PAD-1 family protein [Corallococcus sp. BB11-1]|uniref:Mov34/MPN/PAD-1 family protein n=1 Tax=Corallococcus sp. BB11-1 TaxID=2996783 RepID=UPI003B6326D9